MGGRHILTHSGAKVSEREGCPTIEDVALGLSRAMRFAGQGRCAWSVLQHSLLCEAFAHQYTAFMDAARDGIVMRLHALLHDAHESVTADIPSPLKCSEQQELQYELDDRIFPTLAPEAPYWAEFEDEIKRFDRRALLAEAVVVGPPCLQTAEDVEEHFGEKPYENDVAAVCRMVGMHAGLSADGLQTLFIARYYALRTMLHGTPPTSLERTRQLAEHINESLAKGIPCA